VFVGGLGSLIYAYDALESELLSRVFYALLLGSSLGVQDTQQCLLGDWALRWPEVWKASFGACLLHLSIIFLFTLCSMCLRSDKENTRKC